MHRSFCWFYHGAAQLTYMEQGEVNLFVDIQAESEYKLLNVKMTFEQRLSIKF